MSDFERFNCLSQYLSRSSNVILGIESSCDDTGSAIVNSERKILSESVHSQLQFHLRFAFFLKFMWFLYFWAKIVGHFSLEYRNGGIDPAFAQEIHRANIENVVNESLVKANMTVADVDAIAVTNRPGNIHLVLTNFDKK